MINAYDTGVLKMFAAKILYRSRNEGGSYLHEDCKWKRFFDLFLTRFQGGLVCQGYLNPRTYKQSHTPTMVQGGGEVDGTPPLGFCCVSIFWRDFTFGRKPLMCSTR